MNKFVAVLPAGCVTLSGGPVAARSVAGPGDAYANGALVAAPANSSAIPICTDRPTGANVACTVPGGTVQIETDAINWARFGVGNRRWEDGVILPAIFTLPSGFYLDVGPEIDILADGDRHGHHANLVGIVNLSHAAGRKGAIHAEFWNAHDIDPTGTIHQRSADVGYAYPVSPRLQIDPGGNFGLNRFAPQTQVYAGVGARF